MSLTSDVRELLAEMRVLPLSDGRFLHYHATDRFKTEILSVRFVLPVTVGRASADSLFPALLAKGCRAYPTERAISRRLDELYGTDFAYAVDRSGDRLTIGFTVDYLAGKYVPSDLDLPREVISLLRSMLLEPLADPENGFSPELTRLEVAAQLDRFRSIKNHKMRYAGHRTRELLRDKSRYDVPLYGTEDELTEITPQVLYEQYLHMLSDSEVHFYYVGRETPERILSMLGDLGVTSQPRSASPLIPIRRRATRIRRVTESTDGSQSVLVLGYRNDVSISEDDALLFPLFIEIFSESPISKLFMSVREKKNLCYSVHALSNVSEGGMLISAGIDREKKDEAERAIRRELQKCRRKEISESELACAKESLINAYYTLEDSPVEIDLYNARCDLTDRVVPLSERIRRVREANAEDVARLASRLSLDTVFFLAAGEGGAEDAL